MNHLKGETTKGTSSSQTPFSSEKISNKERGGPFERTHSLDEPSFIAIARFKIKTACAHYNASDILYL
jgi:hypothetical protein